MNKRSLSVLLALALLFLPLFSVQAASDAPELSSKSALVMSLNTKDVIFEENADLVLSPASITKITTTMTVLSLCEDPDNTFITVPDADLFAEITAVGGSNIDLQVGERLSVTQLLYAVMLPSACDACNVLAYHFGNGSLSAFAARMNEWALSAGATQTNFQNAHGLDAPGHKSTVRDTAKIILKALENERFVEMINTLEFLIPENSIHQKRYVNYQSTIPMLYEYIGGGKNPEYYEGMTGIKSGYTLEAGCCLSSMATRGEESFLVICFGAERKDGKNHARTDTAALYDWAFESFETKTLPLTAELGKTVPLTGATESSAEVYAKENVQVCVKKGAEITYQYPTDKPVAPPFFEEAGTLQVLADGTLLREVPLYFKSVPTVAAPEDAPQSEEESDSPALSPVVLAALLITLLLVMLGVAFVLITRPKKKPRKMPARPAASVRVGSAPQKPRPQSQNRRPPNSGRRQG